MEKKLEIAEKTRKNSILIFWGTLSTSLALFILGVTKATSSDTINEATLYQLQMASVVSLLLIPVAITMFNKIVKKVDIEDTKNWCNKYFIAASIRTFCCFLAASVSGAAYYIFGKETFLYGALLGIVALIYVYPGKHELIKLLNGEEGK